MSIKSKDLAFGKYAPVCRPALVLSMHVQMQRSLRFCAASEQRSPAPPSSRRCPDRSCRKKTTRTTRPPMLSRARTRT